MLLIKDLFRSKKPIFSFEVFPAKTPEKHQELLKTLGLLCALNPDFVSCTYGAGGGSREKTFDIVEHIQGSCGIPSMAHLTCIAHTRSEMSKILNDLERRGIINILALRGDPPIDGSATLNEKAHFRYSSDLVGFIRSRFGDRVAIGVAGFPDKHPLAPSFEKDAQYLKSKVSAGADFVITQLFFGNRNYFEYVDRLRRIGVGVPVIPGILPITNYEAMVSFCKKCGAIVTDQVHEMFSPVKDDPTKTLELGVKFAVNQCRELLEGGAPGIHFYALNKVSPLDRILEQVRSI